MTELTDKDIGDLFDLYKIERSQNTYLFARAVEAKIKERQRILRHYQSCKAHEGRNWNMFISSAHGPTSIETVCPICTGEAT